MNILIKGKVQGVFFRKFTCDAAKEYGITGFVRNEPDGSVYVEATGNSDQIEKFSAWCRTGSPFSLVEHVIVRELPFQNYSNFIIRY